MVTITPPTDLTLETSVTSGTGPVTTGGAPRGFQTWQQAGGAALNGAPYFLRSGDGVNWESGIVASVTAIAGGFSIIARTPVRSTNANGPIALDGVSQIACDVTGAFLAGLLQSFNGRAGPAVVLTAADVTAALAALPSGSGGLIAGQWWLNAGVPTQVP